MDKFVKAFWIKADDSPILYGPETPEEDFESNDYWATNIRREAKLLVTRIEVYIQDKGVNGKGGFLEPLERLAKLYEEYKQHEAEENAPDSRNKDAEDLDRHLETYPR